MWPFSSLQLKLYIQATSLRCWAPHDLLGMRVASINDRQDLSHTPAAPQGLSLGLAHPRNLCPVLMAPFQEVSDLTLVISAHVSCSSQVLAPHDLLGARIACINAWRDCSHAPARPQGNPMALTHPRDLGPLAVAPPAQVLGRVQPALPGVCHEGEPLLPVVLPILPCQQLCVNVLLHSSNPSIMRVCNPAIEAGLVHLSQPCRA